MNRAESDKSEGANREGIRGLICNLLILWVTLAAIYLTHRLTVIDQTLWLFAVMCGAGLSQLILLRIKTGNKGIKGQIPN